MRKPFTLLTLGALALALALPALAHEGDRFKGLDSGPFEVTSFVFPIACTKDVATGKANHGIGRYTLVASECVNLLPPFNITDGQFTLTARNGSFSGTYSGTAALTDDPAVITYHVEGPITGGTGRHGQDHLRRGRHLPHADLRPPHRPGQRCPVRARRRRRLSRRGALPRRAVLLPSALGRPRG